MSDSALEESGDINELQWKRWHAWQEELEEAQKNPDDTCKANVSGLLKTEIKLREHTQSQISTQLQLENAQSRLQQHYSKKDKKRDKLVYEIKELREEIEKLSWEYWLLERKWWSQRVTVQEGGKLKSWYGFMAL